MGFVRALGCCGSRPRGGVALSKRLLRLAPRAFAPGVPGTQKLFIDAQAFNIVPIDRKMLGAQKPLHLRQAKQRRQNSCDLMGEQAVAVLREIEHALVDRNTNGRVLVDLWRFPWLGISFSLPFSAKEIRAMPSAVKLRDGYSAEELRALARRSKDANQSRRLLSLAAVRDGMERGEAAKIGGMDLVDAARLGASL